MDSTFFIFNKIFYKQIFGTSMSFPLSLINVDLIMQVIMLKP